MRIIPLEEDHTDDTCKINMDNLMYNSLSENSTKETNIIKQRQYLYDGRRTLNTIKKSCQSQKLQNMLFNAKDIVEYCQNKIKAPSIHILKGEITKIQQICKHWINTI